MTRTRRVGDRDHVGLANGTAAPEEHLPRFFGKANYTDTAPTISKKQGGGKGNWGTPGMSELEDMTYNPTKPRRRTNSFSAAAGHSPLKTKFEAIDPQEAVFYDEELHGPTAEDLRLEKMMTASSTGTMGSVEEEDAENTAFESKEEENKK